MDTRNKIGLYGAYFLGMSGIGFTLPFLPYYLGQLGLSDGQISMISALAALTALAQFPIGIWSDRLGSRKPFLVLSLALLALSTFLLHDADAGGLSLAILIVLFAENGICRAVVESLSGAEATCLAPPNEVGTSLGALRFWKPVSIVCVALLSGFIEERDGVREALLPLAALQLLAIPAVLLIREPPCCFRAAVSDSRSYAPTASRGICRDATLWVFVAAMVLFHAANAPAGVYLGLFLKRDLGAPGSYLSYAFVISMATWMLVVRPLGRLVDRIGRWPLLVFGWAAMAVRLALLAMAREPWQVLAIQCLDGFAGGAFAVLAAAWVTDRLADSRRLGEAQVLVGCSLVGGSALGPALCGLVVENLGFRDTFWLLAGVGALAWTLVFLAVPETLRPIEPTMDAPSNSCTRPVIERT